MFTISLGHKTLTICHLWNMMGVCLPGPGEETVGIYLFAAAQQAREGRGLGMEELTQTNFLPPHLKGLL